MNLNFNFLKLFDLKPDPTQVAKDEKSSSSSKFSFFNPLSLDNDNIDSELHNSKIYDKEGPSVDSITTKGLPSIDSFASGSQRDDSLKTNQKQRRFRGNSQEPKGKSGSSITVGPNVPLKAVLPTKAAMKLFQNGNSTIITYLCLRIDDLIQACFNKDDRDMADNAYSILLTFDHKITHHFIRADRFQQLGSDLTIPEDPDMFMMGRFTSIISGILDIMPDILIDQCGFLCRLIHHIYLPEISLLLNKICKNDESLENLQKYILKLGFHEIVHRELINYRHTDFEFEYQYYQSKEVQRTAALYRLMASCLSSKILSKSFMSIDFISICEIEYDITDRIIDDQKWLAILAFFTPQFSSQLLNFVYSAVMQLRAAKTKFYHCHYYALKFLSFMIKYSSETEELLMATDFIPQLLRLLFTFNESSFFQEVFRKFIAATFSKKKIVVNIVQMIIPALMGMLSDDYNIGIKGTLCEIFGAIEMERKYNNVLDQELNNVQNYKDFYDSRVVLRSYLISSSYGESYRGQLENLEKY
ncbi:hypothetical protein TVAG_213230 [Trichomonas vaginalis G3]|uniref:Serine/threonine-protein phosphatase 4 regulatory subunit 3-like central domain-containing protein n=1 Tax=Trichomonas vaginalis (strain ATCC PRA-98 / G3) TaxID=412133 RepID=A2EEU8_TRIV3|nr:hypothetical protein TVAGG3_0061360 [Trichomonas vaginalis G3]EAY08814.1 hypothetical protein TVAG_213230 [Trichomonas vaginalis G3]KAI5542034.1 hypothetical protein TVAGG3_0061360 [Trichomonas vaginalis G3]|eukprot:XP_001321037.1 hypothetical protein [Trichomonas vaginalis G3]